MEEENKKLQLPKNLQLQMINFFLKTSIPKSIKEKQNNPLSNKNLEEEKKQ